MRRIKKILPLFLFVPFGAGAIAPIAVALIAGAGAIAGFSIYRSLVPVDLSGTFAFFSSCWSCGLFSDILGNLSDFIPKIYGAIGTNIVPIAAGLTFVWFAWQIMNDYIKVQAKIDAWDITGKFGTHVIKLAFVAALMSFPLPRFVMDTFVSPVMNIGLSYNHLSRSHIQPGDAGFDACIIATSLKDKFGADGAYGAKLRGNLACQVAEFHKLTGLGMTVGSTFAGMSFDKDYMYKIGAVPIFPNVMLIFAGLSMLILFLWALLPIPLYFLKVFISLSLDLVMLPLMLLGWLFRSGPNPWNIFPDGGKSVKGIVGDAVKSTCGIALVGLFTGFAVLFLNEAVGMSGGTSALTTALLNNDSKYLMNGLMFNNSSVANIVMAGLFTGAFMNAIPRIIDELFKNAKAPDISPLQNAISGIIKNAKDGIEKKIKALQKKTEAPPAPAGGGAGTA